MCSVVYMVFDKLNGKRSICCKWHTHRNTFIFTSAIKSMNKNVIYILICCLSFMTRALTHRQTQVFDECFSRLKMSSPLLIASSFVFSIFISHSSSQFSSCPNRTTTNRRNSIVAEYISILLLLCSLDVYIGQTSIV